MSVSAGIKVACATCGVLFPKSPSHARRSHRHTCPDCPNLTGAIKSQRVPLVCQHCQQSFTRRPTDLNKTGSGTFCSMACVYASRAANPQPFATMPQKFKRTVRVAPTIAPAAWQWPVDSGSSAVVCARCSRTRERGVRCSCEKGGVGGE